MIHPCSDKKTPLTFNEKIQQADQLTVMLASLMKLGCMMLSNGSESSRDHALDDKTIWAVQQNAFPPSYHPK
jgi:hypothetical protein